MFHSSMIEYSSDGPTSRTCGQDVIPSHAHQLVQFIRIHEQDGINIATDPYNCILSIWQGQVGLRERNVRLRAPS